MINNNADIVIVGGGPVGLWFGVQAKILNKNSNIVILDKYYPDYQRSHVLKLLSGSFQGIPNHPKLKNIAKKFAKKMYVRTDEIEEKLGKLATELGIIIKKTKVKNPKTLKTKYPNAKIIIGADGAHSITREKIFKGKESQRLNLQHIAEIKYKVKAKKKCNKIVGSYNKLKNINCVYRTSKIFRRLVTEHEGREKEGTIQKTARIIIDKDTYLNSNKASFKTPFKPFIKKSQITIDKKLQKKIIIWLNMKKQKTGEEFLPKSVKVTVTPLPVYIAERVVKKEPKGPTWCLVGDAAFGVPFFRSLNNGLLCGTKLAKSITKQFQNEKGSHLDSYATYAKKLAKRESFMARIKSIFISITNLYLKLSGRVPWQVNKWAKKDIHKFETWNG